MTRQDLEAFGESVTTSDCQQNKRSEQRPRRLELNKHMPGVYCDNQFLNEFLLLSILVIPSAACHIPQWAALPSLTEIWQWDARSTSQELH